MEFYALHREQIPFRVMYLFSVLLGLIAAGMLGLVVYSVTVAPIDNQPWLTWMFLGECLVMGSLSFLLFQFSTYELVLTPEGIVIKFGKIKKFLRWQEIDTFSLITNGSVLSSGGWKIGLGSRGWYSQYTVVGKPRVALQLKSGEMREIVFSTGSPETVATMIKKQTGREMGPDVGGYSWWM